MLGTSVVSRFTEPPPHLTESELLGLMEQHGIGTDASMAQHIANVVKRGYVTLDESTRQLIPSPLGSALVHAYMLVDPELVLPTVRAGMEAQCAQIARGAAQYEDVVSNTLELFLSKFKNVEARLHVFPLMLAVGCRCLRSYLLPCSRSFSCTHTHTRTRCVDPLTMDALQW